MTLIGPDRVIRLMSMNVAHLTSRRERKKKSPNDPCESSRKSQATRILSQQGDEDDDKADENNNGSLPHLTKTRVQQTSSIDQTR